MIICWHRLILFKILKYECLSMLSIKSVRKRHILICNLLTTIVHIWHLIIRYWMARDVSGFKTWLLQTFTLMQQFIRNLYVVRKARLHNFAVILLTPLMFTLYGMNNLLLNSVYFRCPQVRLIFAPLKTWLITEYVDSVPFWQLVANIGSTMGICTGSSIVSLIHMFVYSFAWCYNGNLNDEKYIKNI